MVLHLNLFQKRMSKYNIDKTEEEWLSELSEEQYRVLRDKGTERAHTGKFNLHFENVNIWKIIFHQ